MSSNPDLVDLYRVLLYASVMVLIYYFGIQCSSDFRLDGRSGESSVFFLLVEFLVF